MLRISWKNDYIVITGDLNARIGNLTLKQLIGPHGEPTLNDNGIKLRDFCTFNKLRVTNTFFKHKNTHNYTWEARGTISIKIIQL